MSNLIALVSLYYMCDQAAAQRVMTAFEVSRCMATYEQIKLEFIDETPAALGSVERAAQSRLGYRGFKAWEAAHPDLVRRLRSEARVALDLG